jgi:hydrogenase assembly chaperone HypC/HupF
MCVSVPAKVCSLQGTSAEVEVMGMRRRVLINAPDVETGSWVLVYAGAALKTISEKEARKILSLLRGMTA